MATQPDARAALDRLPRVTLAQLPTPFEPLPNLTRALGGPALFIKRDDQTGLATGGNKTRKLEFLVAEALGAGADTLITAGSTQSNHARQTAAAAARRGLACHLVLYAPDGIAPREITGNLLIDHLLGATIHWTEERAPYAATLARVEAEVRAAGRRPHLIPYGGSNALGVAAYASAFLELADQMAGGPDPAAPFDAVVFATSSGGTQAGLLLGAQIAGLAGATALHGVSVDQPRAGFAPRVEALLRDGAALLGAEVPAGPEIIIDDRHLGGGYAVVGEPEREAIHLMARHEGILVDPVYTGRALAGLIDAIRRGEWRRGQRVLFWHTGGAAALFAFGDALNIG